MGNVHLSLCGLALLGVVVDAAGVRSDSDWATQDELFTSVPPHARIDELPGQIESWPHDVWEWIDELQRLIDVGFVTRQAGEHCFLYVPTTEGIRHVRALVHPTAYLRGSVA